MPDESSDTDAGISRRAVLSAVTAGATGLAGCTGGGCDVGIEKTTQGTFQYGSQGTYEITIFNDTVMFGTCSGEIVVEDDLPPGITFDSVSGNWSANISGGVLTATNNSYGSLGPQSSITLEVTVDIAPASGFPTSPPVTNCVTGTIGGEDIHPGDNCVTHEFGGQSTPTAPETKTPTATASETPTESPTRTPTETDTPRPTPTETDTPRPTPTETDAPRPTPTETRTATATESPTAEPTATPKETPTETPTQTPTETSTRQRR